jgi:hypothetical protein
MKPILFFVFLVSFILSCERSSEEKASAILNKSIEAHGGLEAFQQLHFIAFNKTTRLFSEDGLLESEKFQKQSFQLHPNYEFQMEWFEKGEKHQLLYDRVQIRKFVNDSLIIAKEEIDNALQLALAADYVFFQPFKLADPNAILNFKGHLKLSDSLEVSSVQIKYETDTSQSDVWEYFFNKKNLLVANLVKHKNKYSLIENLEFQTYKDVLFNKHRKSYFVDSLLQKKQLRAEYFYEIIK